jgi:hypothetical protein
MIHLFAKAVAVGVATAVARQIVHQPNPGPPPAWYPDPWREAAWRWFDGCTWTAWTTPPAADDGPDWSAIIRPLRPADGPPTRAAQ